MVERQVKVENDRCMDSSVLQRSIVFFDLKREPKAPCPADQLPRRANSMAKMASCERDVDLNLEKPMDLSRVAANSSTALDCSVLHKIGSWALPPESISGKESSDKQSGLTMLFLWTTHATESPSYLFASDSYRSPSTTWARAPATPPLSHRSTAVGPRSDHNARRPLLHPQRECLEGPGGAPRSYR